MKKLCVAVILTTLSPAVYAQSPGFNAPEGQGYIHGGFSGPAPTLTTVAVAKTLRDDAWVVLEGNITRQIGHELYEFKDASGTIMVEIDAKYWMGQSVTPATRLRIEGEIDRDWNNLEVDAKSVRILN
ncbi:YgiW/YdeI family stress tolerance OB fold protein [Citrobacter amalonaticus]|uniref:YgiW/YdeI family stress tolerance OB fold protein n=1 Tax=Citrobacter amalonaticus TaxID=35703 RepID=UPI003D6E5D5A